MGQSLIKRCIKGKIPTVGGTDLSLGEADINDESNYQTVTAGKTKSKKKNNTSPTKKNTTNNTNNNNSNNNSSSKNSGSDNDGGEGGLQDWLNENPFKKAKTNNNNNNNSNSMAKPIGKNTIIYQSISETIE